MQYATVTAIAKGIVPTPEGFVGKLDHVTWEDATGAYLVDGSGGGFWWMRMGRSIQVAAGFEAGAEVKLAWRQP